MDAFSTSDSIVVPSAGLVVAVAVPSSTRSIGIINNRSRQPFVQSRKTKRKQSKTKGVTCMVVLIYKKLCVNSLNQGLGFEYL